MGVHLPILRVFVVCGVATWGLTACGGPALSEEQLVIASAMIVERAEMADLDLADDDARCVAEKLSPAEAEQLLEADQALGAVLSERLTIDIVSCVGASPLARSALESFVSHASEDSVACAADRVPHDLVVSLVAAELDPVTDTAALEGDENRGGDADGDGDGDSGEASTAVVPSALEVQSAVVEALVFCLDPDELLSLLD